MRNDEFYQKLVIKMQQVALIPPQEVGWLTPIYRKIVPQFKFFPFKALIPFSFFLIFFAYLIFGTWLVRLAELLQAGF